MKGRLMFAPLGWLFRPVTRHIYKTIASSDFFDRRWYRRKNLRGLSIFTDSVWHFIRHGYSLQPNPSPRFDSSHYVAHNHDVRKSKINPLFHYLEYGIEERRSPRGSVRNTCERLFPDARELPTFLTPRHGRNRLTLVVDGQTLDRPDTVLSDLLEKAAQMAGSSDRDLRVISLLADSTALSAALSHRKSLKNLPGLSLVTSPAHSETTNYDTFEDEVFLATSWTSCAAIRFAARPENLWCFAPSGYSNASENTVIADGVVVLTPQMWRMWSLDSVADTVAPTHDSLLAGWTSKRDATDDPFHIGLVADVALAPVDYAWALRELEAFVMNHDNQRLGVSVTLIGWNLHPITLCESLMPTITHGITKGLMDSLDVLLVPGQANVPGLERENEAVLEVPSPALGQEGLVATVLATVLSGKVASHD